MSRSYKATGINLKAMPIGETDRLLTILTREQGLIRAVAPGARKHKSRLGGRSGQFVINDLLVIQGKQLDKVVQAETVQSFPGLATDLTKLTASQYLAELVLCQALSEQPQGELFSLFVEHLERLEQASAQGVMAGLCQGIFHLLALAGIAPEVQRCCVSQQTIQPSLGVVNWQAGFSAIAGGVIGPDQLNTAWTATEATAPRLRTPPGRYPGRGRAGDRRRQTQTRPTLITAAELALLQRLGQPELLVVRSALPQSSSEAVAQDIWSQIERLLRDYAQYHFDRPIRSATLLDACFPVAVAPD
jgi:DNA repair protein RecO (recombination protein O)